MEKFSKEWFELQDVRRRLFSKTAWVPVFGCDTIIKENKCPEIGYKNEILAIGAAVISQEHREKADKLDWHDWSHDTSSSHLGEDGIYYESDAFKVWPEEEIGFRLVLTQYINSNHPRLVTIHQDFIYAYGLIEDGNKWLRPHSGYEEVIRVKRDERNVITFVEIRMEYLRDYLAARNSALRLYYYREREMVMGGDPSFNWPDNGKITGEEHDKLEVRCYEIDETGDRPGSSWAVFTARRTDVDPEEDIPDFRSNDDENIISESRTGVREGHEARYRVSGALWRGEWIEPAEKSERLGNSEPEEDFTVSVNASGTKVGLESLRHEEGRYLWFDASLATALLSRRGSHINWYTSETGTLSGSPDDGVHFGVNKLGHINALAYDVARLSVWERRIWASKNILPDGGVSGELMKAQMECNPAGTKSAEYLLKYSVEWLQECCEGKYGENIVDDHFEIKSIEKNLHRFRALDEEGLRRLGKDVTKLTIERLNKKTLQKILGLRNSKFGTLKLLEALLAKVTDEAFAKNHMAPLFGVYDLRGSDAHLASSDIEEAYTRIGIDRSEPFVIQGEMLIKSVADTIGVIGTQIKKHSK